MTAATLGSLRQGFNPKDPIPVNGKPIPKPKRFALQIAWGGIVAVLIAGPIIMTGYFFVTQVKYPGHIAGQPLYLKPYWDRLFDSQFGYTRWSESRHLWRNLLDPILGTIFVKSLMANWKKDPDNRCSMLYLILSPLILLVVATVLIAGVAGLIYWWVPAISAHVPNTVIQVVAGILIGLVIHPIYAPAGRTVQGFFVDRQVWKARNLGGGAYFAQRYAPPGWFPPVVQELYWHKIDNRIPVAKSGAWVRFIVPVFAFVAFAMTVFGLLIKFGIAPGYVHLFGV